MTVELRGNLWLGLFMADCRNTLMVPFDKGTLATPEKGQDWVLLNAGILPHSDGNWRGILRCEQGFRPAFLTLEATGYQVKPLLEDFSSVDCCLVLASRSRAVNERNMTRAWNGVKPGGLVLFSGDVNAGVKSVRKWTGKRMKIDDSISKHHAVAFWVHRKGADWPLEAHDGSGDYSVLPGMFSSQGPDKGSQLLVQHFDNRIFGRVADFGAGWGYLSARLAQQCERIEQLELYEADWASLEAAKSNVGRAAAYHWVDMTSEAPRGPFNWIVMNPPFHSGRAATPDLGNAFITAAARSLPAGGRLLMVANINLPYEKTLQSLFKTIEVKEQAHGFKVLEAVKGSR